MSERRIYSEKDLSGEGPAFVEAAAKVDAAFDESGLAGAASKVEAIFQKSSLPNSFAPEQPPAAEQLSTGNQYTPEKIIHVQVDAAIVEAGLNRAFDQGEEDPPQTSTVSILLYLKGEGQLAHKVDEGARRAGLAETADQTNVRRPLPGLVDLPVVKLSGALGPRRKPARGRLYRRG